MKISPLNDLLSLFMKLQLTYDAISEMTNTTSVNVVNQNFKKRSAAPVYLDDAMIASQCEVIKNCVMLIKQNFPLTEIHDRLDAIDDQFEFNSKHCELSSSYRELFDNYAERI